MEGRVIRETRGMIVAAATRVGVPRTTVATVMWVSKRRHVIVILSLFSLVQGY
jgi:hypothetical protein